MLLLKNGKSGCFYKPIARLSILDKAIQKLIASKIISYADASALLLTDPEYSYLINRFNDSLNICFSIASTTDTEDHFEDSVNLLVPLLKSNRRNFLCDFGIAKCDLEKQTTQKDISVEIVVYHGRISMLENYFSLTSSPPSARHAAAVKQ